ncbi:uncharacterized protein RCC_08047 [Ramularia collo-cygni]|uniref:Uncharacterized protein n=1 Tax=Ramularia collo-cygni TaxID=112498 RepID=A0A2D3V2Y1_9PEZI|nr:uncharacterized protein RCC_08047 [Ramularia collo-cygni]CZT22178.1 uncharacterized protein RCC_08047 [Ramularia collo-cygni]
MTVSTPLLIQLKRTTLESINSAIEWAGEEGRVQDSVIAAIALLGQWELEYGDAPAHDTHMAGLVGIVNCLRGGLSGLRSPGSQVLSPVVVNLIVSAGHDAALYANKRPSFDRPGGMPSHTTATLPSTLPSGLKDLEMKRLIMPTLLHLIGRLSHTASPNPAVQARLVDTRQALSDWDLFTSTGASFSIFQTMLEDHMKWQAHSHLRLAGLMLSSLLLNDVDLLTSLYAEAQNLRPEFLVGTVYEELAFWSLFMICATTGQRDIRHMQILRRLQIDLGLDIWEALQEFLLSYCHQEVLVGSSHALWVAVSGVTYEKSANVGITDSTRYVKGSRHPMTWVGTSVMNE